MKRSYRYFAACTKCFETFASDSSIPGIQWADEHSIYCGPKGSTVEFGPYADVQRAHQERLRWYRHEQNALKVG